MRRLDRQIGHHPVLDFETQLTQQHAVAIAVQTAFDPNPVTTFSHVATDQPATEGLGGPVVNCDPELVPGIASLSATEIGHVPRVHNDRSAWTSTPNPTCCSRG